MYLAEIIEDIIPKKLQDICVNHTVTFVNSKSNQEETIFCTDVKLYDDDGDCWIEFTDDNGKVYQTFDQGIDIWFEVQN